jgi:hypothetical protein
MMKNLLLNETYRLGKAFFRDGQRSQDQDFLEIAKLGAQTAGISDTAAQRAGLRLVKEDYMGSLFEDKVSGRLWALYDCLDRGSVKILHCIHRPAAKAFYLRSWDINKIQQHVENMYSLVPPTKEEAMLCGISYVALNPEGLTAKIKWLVNSVFQKVTPLATETLYWDQHLGCFWEHVLVDYLPDALGGGTKTIAPNPSFLHQVDEGAARLKYVLSKT